MKKDETWRLVLVPALVSLGVSLLRLTGELLHWSENWFSTATGGVIPSGSTWLVGITWLAVPFGIYFAWALLRMGGEPTGFAARALAFAFVGLAVSMLDTVYAPPIPFPRVLLYVWAMMAAGAAIAYRGWPSLGRILLVYGLAARVPVAIIMFLAMRGHWGTHYDYVGMPAQFQMSFWRGFFWLAFFPQLVFWVSFTVVIGSLAGSIAAVFLPKGSKDAAD